MRLRRYHLIRRRRRFDPGPRLLLLRFVLVRLLLLLLSPTQVQTGRIDDRQMIIVVVDFVGREQLPRRQYLLLFGEEHLQRRLDLRIAGSQTGRQRLDLHLDVLQVFLFLGCQLYRVYPLVL